MTMLSGDALRAELSRRAFLGYGAAFGALGIAAPALLATGVISLPKLNPSASGATSL